jgi:hypothetical protein
MLKSAEMKVCDHHMDEVIGTFEKSTATATNIQQPGSLTTFLDEEPASLRMNGSKISLYIPPFRDSLSMTRLSKCSQKMC